MIISNYKHIWILIRRIYDDDDYYYVRREMSSFLELQPIKTMRFNKSDSRFIISSKQLSIGTNANNWIGK